MRLYIDSVKAGKVKRSLLNGVRFARNSAPFALAALCALAARAGDPAAPTEPAKAAPPARATTKVYRLVQQESGPGITISIPYSLGTHDNRVSRATGEVRFDPDAPQAAAGTLRVTLDAVVSDSAERDCHMREALGLDYAHSRFPGEHVCANNALPAGALAYPEIRLEVRSAQSPGLSELSVGKETPISLEASWTLHGVTRPAVLRLTASRDAKTPGALRIRGTSPIRLPDFGVVVKSAKVLFATISVEDVATVRFDLKLEPALEPAP